MKATCMHFWTLATHHGHSAAWGWCQRMFPWPSLTQRSPPPPIMSPQDLLFSLLIADRQMEHATTPPPKVQCAEIILVAALSTGHIASVWGSKCPKNRWHPKQKGPVFVHVASHLDVEACSPMENVKEEGKCFVCCSDSWTSCNSQD